MLLFFCNLFNSKNSELSHFSVLLQALRTVLTTPPSQNCKGARVISVRVNRHAMAMQFAQLLDDGKARDVRAPHDSRAKHATSFLTLSHG